MKNSDRDGNSRAWERVRERDREMGLYSLAMNVEPQQNRANKQGIPMEGGETFSLRESIG